MEGAETCPLEKVFRSLSQLEQFSHAEWDHLIEVISLEGSATKNVFQGTIISVQAFVIRFFFFLSVEACLIGNVGCLFHFTFYLSLHLSVSCQYFSV